MERANGVGTVAFKGRLLMVRVDPVTAKSGPATREVVERPPAVAVLAQTDQGHLIVIRQYRWAVQQELAELPAGLIDPGEQPEEAARRELAEETGYHAHAWRLLTQFYTSPGFSTERIYLYHARDLVPGPANGDPDEEITVEYWDKSRARAELAHSGTANGVLLTGILWWLGGPRSDEFG